MTARDSLTYADLPGLPWRVNDEEERVICTSDYRMLGAMDTPELARYVVDVVNAGDGDTRVELTEAKTLVRLYRDRDQMTPSERQGYLGETVEQAIQPENRYHVRYVEPVKRLKETLDGLLAVDEHSDRTPEQAMRELREAVTRFTEETASWWW